MIPAEDHRGAVPLAYRLQVFLLVWWEKVVQRSGPVARQRSIGVAIVVEDLVFEPERGVVGRLRHGGLLGHVVLDAAVPAGGDLPLPAQLEATEGPQRHQFAALAGLPARPLG